MVCQIMHSFEEREHIKHGKKQNDFMAILELKITHDQKLEADTKYSPPLYVSCISMS